jgi:DNA (cytosine-5)-methyltransferase 1
MTRKLRVLDLFSGLGGFSLGLERTGGFETVAFCEIEEFPRRVLAKHWPDVPCFQDVRKLKGSDIGTVDVICGGYPCQPFSTAGKRQGAADDRHLWPEFMRIVAELRPSWVIGENVAGHISMGLDDVLADLEAENYTARTFVIPACAVGASHRRDRVWTVAHASDMQRNGCKHHPDAGEGQVPQSGAGSRTDDVAYAIGGGRPGPGEPVNASHQAAGGKGQAAKPEHGGERGKWRVESRMGGVADGFSCWLDEPRERVKPNVKDRAPRLKALGNAVHPDIPMMIGAAILEAEQEKA